MTQYILVLLKIQWVVTCPLDITMRWLNDYPLHNSNGFPLIVVRPMVRAIASNL